MKCPFNSNLSQVNQYRYQYDDDNNEVIFQEHKLIQRNELRECLKEECAMWQDNKCIRRCE